MKVTWEESDIQPGRRYGKPTIRERWIIGYSVGSVDKQKLFHSVSLSDGLTLLPAITRSMLASNLTESGYLPEELLQK